MKTQEQLRQFDDPGVSKGKLFDVFKKNTLPFVRGEMHGRVGKETEFLPFVSFQPAELDMDMFEKGRVNALYVRGMGAILATNRLVKEDYLEGIGGLDFQNIPSVVATLANESVRKEKQSKQVVVRLIYGASEEISLRALASYASTLSYIDSLRQAGLAVPQFQMIFPHYLSSSLNECDTGKVQTEIARFTRVAKKYEERFFPDLSGTTIFLEDKPQDEDGQYYSSINFLASYLRENISDNVRERLMGRGHEEVGEDMKITYGAAHSYFHDTPADRTLCPITSLQNQPEMIIPTMIINTGGYQEQDFYDVRFETRDALVAPLVTMQLFTRFRVPPYVMARGIDVSLSEALADPSVRSKVPKDARAVKKDIVYLDDVSAKRGDLGLFLKQMEDVA